MSKQNLIDRLSNISRIAILDSDKEKYEKRIIGILDWFNILEEIDTEGVEPMFGVQEFFNNGLSNLREDIVSEKNNQETLMENAPDKEDIFFAVPKVIE